STFTADVATRWDDGNLRFVWVDYDGSVLEVRASDTPTRPDTAVLATPMDLATILGAQSAVLGFTASTGGAWGTYDIISWTASGSEASTTTTISSTSTTTTMLTGFVENVSIRTQQFSEEGFPTALAPTDQRLFVSAPLRFSGCRSLGRLYVF